MKIAVLVSGGVDSSVALALLKQQGHDVTAFYLKIWLEDELSFLGTCPWEEDLKFVEAVCNKLEVPLEVISLQKEYWDEVVKHTIEQVKIGHTPNPDILCNSRIKFKAFFDKINKDFEFVATGHYAQVIHENGLSKLYMAPDAIKDQTYFLSHLTQAQLSRVIFPIGHLNKSQVRELAQEFNLINKDRKDSQGICFLGKLKYSDFIKFHLGEKKGDLIEYETGKKVGQHSGYWFYTVGQRQGLGLAGGPWYVVSKQIEQNIVFISRQYYTQEKSRDKFKMHSCNWINQEAPLNVSLSIKIRHGARMHKGVLHKIDDNYYHVKLEEQDQGLASGQYAVIYDNNLCLGGGIIEPILTGKD